jgi:hypothetical protein
MISVLVSGMIKLREAWKYLVKLLSKKCQVILANGLSFSVMILKPEFPPEETGITEVSVLEVGQ